MYDTVATLRRAYLHDAIARSLERVADPDDEVVAALASHLRAAVPVGRAEDAMRWSVEAGSREMRRAAFDEACTTFDAALAIGRDHPRVDRRGLADVLIG